MGGWWGGGRGWGQGGCERRIEVFVKIHQKKIFFFLGGGRWEGSGWVRVDVNEIEVFVKIQKKIIFFWGGGGRGGGGGGSRGWVGG